MFRLPLSSKAPSFDDVRKVGFFEWLISKKADRIEWARRRDAAAHAAATVQRVRADTWAAEKAATRRARRRHS